MEGMQDLFAKQIENGLFQQQYQKIIQEVLADAEIQRFLEEHQTEITPETLEKSYSALLEYIKERDARIHKENVKAPGMEPMLNLHQGFIEVVYRPTEAFLQQRRERELRNRVHAMNMPKNILEAKFADMALTQERGEIIQEALSFIQQMSQNPQKFQQALYLVGPFGVGKTYILGAIANELAQQGFVSTLVHVPTLSSEMKQAIANNQVEEKLEALKTTPVLMLDDIGAEMNSAWFRDEVLMIILQYRMMQELPTFFSSNFTISQLQEHLTVSNRGDQEAMKAQRIIERVRYLAKELFLDGANRRHS